MAASVYFNRKASQESKYFLGKYYSREYLKVHRSVLINQFVLLTFCLCFCFTGINFRGMLHHVCDVVYDKNRCGPIRTRKCRGTN